MNAAIARNTAARASPWGLWPQPGTSQVRTGPATPAAMAASCAGLP
jgi:hypothetical protein